MIYLRTIRLDFLDLGPKIENLEIFEHIENLYLQYNKLSEIGNGLAMNRQLVFLALSNNQIKRIEGLSHLKQLAYLDISHNLIEAIPDVREIPANLLMLKTNGNPVQKYTKDYRKPIVLHASQLEVLDRVKVVQAEKLAYKGLIRIDVDKMVEQYRLERQEADAKERMEKDLYLDFMETKGLESRDRMMKQLDDFSKMEEFDKLQGQFTRILKDQKSKEDEN